MDAAFLCILFLLVGSVICPTKHPFLAISCRQKRLFETSACKKWRKEQSGIPPASTRSFLMILKSTSEPTKPAPILERVDASIKTWRIIVGVFSFLSGLYTAVVFSLKYCANLSWVKSLRLGISGRLFACLKVRIYKTDHGVAQSTEMEIATTSV